MSRRALPILMLAIVVLAGLPAPTLGAEATAYIDEVTVSPQQPAPGERFTVTTVVQNAQNSPSNLDVTDVYIRRPDSTTEFARVEELGTIPPGSDLRVPLSVRIDKPGTYDLRVNVVGRSDGQTQRLQYPVVVTVREGGPQVSVEVGDAVVGTEAPVSVTVSNGESAPVRNLRLSLSSDVAAVKNDTRVLPTLAAGQAQTFQFSVVPDQTDGELEASLRYVTDEGNARSTVTRATLAADPLRESVRLDATLGDGSRPPVLVEVTNLGNAPLEDLVLRLEDGGGTVVSTPAGVVAAESTRTVRVNVSNVDRATLDVVADYDTGGRTGRATTSVDYVAAPGRIQLTGVDVELEDGKVHVSGSASNVGLSEAQSVVVRVVPTDGVVPARPYKEYFVGSVPASDFASFDLYADVDDGVETVPVEVTYLADGREQTVRTAVDVTGLSAPAQQESGGGVPSTLLIAGGLVAALVVVGVGFYAYRRR